MNHPSRDVETILLRGIEADGGDGLYNRREGCACLKDALAPCGQVKMDCRSGEWFPCDDLTVDGLHRCHIGVSKWHSMGVKR